MLEAIASGRSVVSCDVAGAREAVGTQAGEIVPVEDAAALRTAILRRFEDEALAAAEGDAARRIAEERFGLERTAEAMLDVYREVVSA